MKLTHAVRAVLSAADQLHPAALVLLVLVSAGLAYVAAPAAVQLVTALITGTKAAVLLAGAGVLFRLAYRTAAAYSTRRTGAPA